MRRFLGRRNVGVPLMVAVAAAAVVEEGEWEGEGEGGPRVVMRAAAALVVRSARSGNGRGDGVGIVADTLQVLLLFPLLLLFVGAKNGTVVVEGVGSGGRRRIAARSVVGTGSRKSKQ